MAIALHSASAAAQDDLRIHIHTQIHPDFPPSAVVLQGDIRDQQAEIRRIEIYHTSDRTTPHQRITGIATRFPDLSTAGLVIEDLNFDGYQDLRLPEFLPASPNIPYLYWLYNPETAQFERNRDLEIITSPVVDSEQHLITSFSRVNAVTYVISDYHMEGDRLQLLRERTEIYDRKGRKRVIVKMWQAGEFVIVSDRLEPATADP